MPLTAAQLEQRAVAEGDIDGHRVSVRADADHLDGDEIRTPAAQCADVTRAALGATAGSPSAVVERTAHSGPDGNLERAGYGKVGTTTTVTLAAYGEMAAAERVLGELGEGVSGCTTVFEANVRGAKRQFNVLPRLAGPLDPELRESTSWFTLTDEQGEDAATYNVIVARSGSTLVYASRRYPGGAARGSTLRGMRFPEEAVRAQLAKLARL